MDGMVKTFFFAILSLGVVNIKKLFFLISKKTIMTARSQHFVSHICEQVNCSDHFFWKTR